MLLFQCGLQDNGPTIASELKTAHGTDNLVTAELHLRDTNPLRRNASCPIHSDAGAVSPFACSVTYHHRIKALEIRGFGEPPS